MTSFAASFQAYRMAMALNNMSLVLFQQGSIAGAIKTCNDARVVLQAVMHSQDDAKTLAKKKCDQARKRLVKQMQANRDAGLLTHVALEEQDDNAVMPYQELQDNDADLSTLQFVTEQWSTYSGKMLFPVRMSDEALCAQAEQVTGEVVAKQLGLILYNHGLYHFAASQTLAKNLDKHIAAATKSLTMAEHIFTRLQTAEVTPEQEDSLILAQAPLYKTLSKLARAVVREHKTSVPSPTSTTTDNHDTAVEEEEEATKDIQTPTITRNENFVTLDKMPSAISIPTFSSDKGDKLGSRNLSSASLLNMAFYASNSNAATADGLPTTSLYTGEELPGMSLRDILDQSEDVLNA